MSSQQLLHPSQESENPKNSKAPSRVSVLTIASALATLALFSAILIDAFAIPFADYMILALTATMIINVYVFISLMELKLAAPLIGLKSSTLLWLSVAGLMIWFSHNDALGNVNEIFGVDPTLLPVTVSASAFMHVMIRLKNPASAIPQSVRFNSDIAGIPPLLPVQAPPLKPDTQAAPVQETDGSA